MALNERQRRFVEAYQGVAVGNATEAAKIAGYSQKTAYSIGHDLLKKPEIKAALAANMENSPLVADRKARQEFLTKVMKGEEKDRGDAPAMTDRLRAVDQLNKMGGDYSETIKHDFGDQLKTAHSLLDAVGSSSP